MEYLLVYFTLNSTYEIAYVYDIWMYELRAAPQLNFLPKSIAILFWNSSKFASSILVPCYRFSQVDIRELCENFRSASKNYQNGRALWVDTCPSPRSSCFKRTGHNFSGCTLRVHLRMAGALAGENKGRQVGSLVLSLQSVHLNLWGQLQLSITMPWPRFYFRKVYFICFEKGGFSHFLRWK